MATNVTPPDEKTVSINNENVIIVINEQPGNSVSVSTNTTNITVEEASSGTSTTLEQANSVTANQDTTVITVTQDNANTVTVNNDSSDQITVVVGPAGPQGDRGPQGPQGDSVVNPDNPITIAGITASGAISSSDYIFAKGLFINSSSQTDDFFLIRSGSFSAVSVNSQGTFQLGKFNFVPGPLAGSMYYNDTDDAFYVAVKG